jgi:cytochrome c553
LVRTVWQGLRGFIGAVLIASAFSSPSKADSTTSEKAEDFERHIRPILVNNCVECHGPDTQEADLRLDSAEGLFAGSHSGPVVVPHHPEHSRLVHLVRGGSELQMPPDKRLSSQEIAALERWIFDGAFWPGYEAPPQRNPNVSSDAIFTEDQKSHWAFQPLRPVAPPATADASWPISPIDRFVLARLEEAGLKPAPPANKYVLLRRVTFDLTGLPPTPQEITDFVADKSPAAFAKVVDRLLASPHYGERWGQHWLDVVRFAESAGHDGNNAYLHAWRYRDYVIRSFNIDKPYDQFLIEQLAGDLLPKTGQEQQDYDQIVATGFLQVGPKPVVMRDKKQMLLDIADEQLHTVGVAFMGLTLGCARCHDHKFDPIPIADYYSLAGILTSTQVMADAEPDSKWLEPTVATPDGEQASVMAVQDLPQPANMHVLLRGNYRTPGPEVHRRFLQIIAGSGHPPLKSTGSGRLELARWIASSEHPLTARVMVNRIWQHHFGRGLVATSDNFGRLGEPPSHPDLLDWLAQYFIESGWSVKAMHRLLLLSSTYQQAYVENATAQQIDPENRLWWRMPRRRLSAEEIRDAMLAVSGMLDSSMGGTLFTEGFQPGDESRKLYVVDISAKDPFPPFQASRRSIYLPVLRNARPESLKLFDVANELAPTAVRGETTVAPQALFLLNSPFVRQQAEKLALRLIDLSAGPSDVVGAGGEREAIDHAFQLLFGRPALVHEVERVRRFLDEYRSSASQLPLNVQQVNSEVDVQNPREDSPRLLAWLAACQALLCTHEFIYLE